jgi:hypothetical protein
VGTPDQDDTHVPKDSTLDDQGLRVSPERGV